MTAEERVNAIAAVLVACHRDRADVAEVLSIAITEAATTVGGTEKLLVHRSGSWEAMHVRELSLAEAEL